MLGSFSKAFLTFSILLASLSGHAASPRQARVNELLAKRNYRLGPNCWDAAFYVTGHYPHVLFMTSIQATNLFESVCQRVPQAPSSAPVGTINRLTDNEGREIHAAIKVGANRYFQKRGYAAESEPYEFGHLDDINETDACKKSEGCQIIKTAYSCPAPILTTELLNPLELKINSLARQVSNLIFDSHNPKLLIQIQNGVRLLNSTLQSEELDTWIRGASKTNLLMLADIFQSASALTKPTDVWEEDRSRSIPLQPVLLVSMRLIERADKIRYFMPHERAYFGGLKEVLTDMNLKL